jgi:hypothetical protein
MDFSRFALSLMIASTMSFFVSSYLLNFIYELKGKQDFQTMINNYIPGLTGMYVRFNYKAYALTILASLLAMFWQHASNPIIATILTTLLVTYFAFYGYSAFCKNLLDKILSYKINMGFITYGLIFITILAGIFSSNSILVDTINEIQNIVPNKLGVDSKVYVKCLNTVPFMMLFVFPSMKDSLNKKEDAQKSILLSLILVFFVACLWLVFIKNIENDFSIFGLGIFTMNNIISFGFLNSAITLLFTFLRNLKDRNDISEITNNRFIVITLFGLFFILFYHFFPEGQSATSDSADFMILTAASIFGGAPTLFYAFLMMVAAFLKGSSTIKKIITITIITILLVYLSLFGVFSE